MKNKILVVTNPDYYHGDMTKCLLINPTVEEKNAVQEWLKDNTIDIAIFLYNNDKEITWLLNVAAMADTIYFNLDNSTDMSYHYASYLISKTQVTYKSENTDFSLINKDKVYNINEYIQRHWLA